jgi:hypothetical protein
LAEPRGPPINPDTFSSLTASEHVAVTLFVCLTLKKCKLGTWGTLCGPPPHCARSHQNNHATTSFKSSPRFCNYKVHVGHLAHLPRYGRRYYDNHYGLVWIGSPVWQALQCPSSESTLHPPF